MATLQPWFKRQSLKNQAPVTQACNPSYSRARDQEDHGSKPARANILGDPSWKIPNTKKGWQSRSSGRVPAQQALDP
jgi:hypothetical protein